MNTLRRSTAELPFLYQIWLQKAEPLRNKALQTCDIGPRAPRMIVCLVTDHHTTPEMLARSRESVFGFRDRLDLILLSSHGQSAESDMGQHQMNWREFDMFIHSCRIETPLALLVPLHAGDQLSDVAPAAYLHAWREQPNAVLIYGDEDQIDSNRRRNYPWFKPDWNLEQFLCQDFVSAACALPISSIPDLASLPRPLSPEKPAQTLVYATALAHPQGTVVHIPSVLCHRASSSVCNDDADVRALLSTYLPAGTVVRAGFAGTRRIDWPIPSTFPRVTAIVPTRDQLTLLRQCLAGLEATDYPNLDIVVIDNGTTDPAALEFLETLSRRNIQILPHPGPFNFAAMNNRAAKATTTPLLCFINNDIEFPDPTWLMALVGHGIRPHVGAVGAKLLYPDNTLQHAGVAIGIGGAAGHIHKHLVNESEDFHSEPNVQREMSAVTAACLLVARDKFIEVGGFDEENFAVAFNDVDLCLKLHAAGYVNIYTPHAIAIHHESKSRGNDLAPENVARYRQELSVLQSRWNTNHARDPNWNTNLDYNCEQMSIRL